MNKKKKDKKIQKECSVKQNNVLNPTPNIDIEEKQISIFDWNLVNGFKRMQLIDYTSIIKRCGVPLDFTQFVSTLTMCGMAFFGMNPVELKSPFKEITEFCSNEYEDIIDERELYIRTSLFFMLVNVKALEMRFDEVISVIKSLTYEDCPLEKDIINNRGLKPIIFSFLKEVQFTPKGYFNLVFYISNFPLLIDKIPSYPKNWNWNLLVNSKNQTIYHIIFALSI